MPKSTGPRPRIRRVCFLNPHGYVTNPPPLGKTDTGGQTLYELELAKAMAAHGTKVDIITRRFGDYPEEENVADGVRIVRIRCGGPDFVPKERMYELVPEFATGFLKYAVRKRKVYDIVHSHYWDGGYAGIWVARKLKRPHVHTPHSLGRLKKLEMAVERLAPAKLRPAYRYQVRNAIEQKIIDVAQAVVLLSETNRIQVLQHYVSEFEKLHVIYPGVDISRFRRKPDRYDAGLRLSRNAVLTVSRLVPAKGIDRVVNALADIRKDVPFHLYIAGGTPEEFRSDEERVTEDELRTLVGKRRMTTQVTFVGDLRHDRELPAYYRQSSVFVLAGKYEPFGLTTLEAMACGTAPVVSDVAGSREAIVNGLNGFIEDMNDRKHLASTLRSLLKNRRLRDKISENAAFTIKEDYSWERISSQHQALYRSLQ